MSNMPKFQMTYSWEEDVAPYIHDLIPVEGGFTPARRGVVKLADGNKVFLKIAEDEMTAKWLKKEIKVYQILNTAGYQYIPRLLAVNSDHTAMAIEYLDGASFENVWDSNKLEAVMQAQNALKQYAGFVNTDPEFKSGDVMDLEFHWPHLLEPGTIAEVNDKLKKLGASVVFTKEQIEDFQNQHNGWIMKVDTLIHEDIRADNFGYDSKSKQGKLVDWNWLCLGDKSLDITPLFINMYISGFDPYEYHPEKYDRKMLIYLAGFWLTSILDGNQNTSEQEWKLRTAQAKNVEACIQLLNRDTSSG